LEEIIRQLVEKRSNKKEFEMEAQRITGNGQGIDFRKILMDIMKHKRLYFMLLPIALFLAIIYSIGLPDYYICTVKLSPELSSERSNTSFKKIAKSFGVNLSLGNDGSDALFPIVYPELLNSVDFKTSLFDVIVKKDSVGKGVTYYDYLLNEQKIPWWFEIIGKISGMFTSVDVEGVPVDTQETVDPFKLTPLQDVVAQAIFSRVICEVHMKTLLITINVIDQDPEIAAIMADSVKVHLQDFITAYRVNKARNDFEHYKKVSAKIKKDYEKASADYARFTDRNQDITSQKTLQQQTALENEVKLQFTAYEESVIQMHDAECKMQEARPAFTTLQSATVPLEKSGPNRLEMCLSFVITIFLFITVWILYKEDDLETLIGFNNIR
jgi:hypothetical protein